MAAFARALLRVVTAVAAATAAVALLVVNPLTRPVAIGEAAIDAGAAAVLRSQGLDLMIEQIISGESGDGPTESMPSDQADRLRVVLEDSLTEEWLEATIVTVTADIERWVEGTGRPVIAVDLTDPKERIRTNPDARLLVATTAGDERGLDPDDIRPELIDRAIDDFLSQIPDRVPLSDSESWEETVASLADARTVVRRGVLVGGVVALLGAMGGVWLTRRPRHAAVASWAGWVSLWVSLPLLVLSWVLPGVVSALPGPELSTIVGGVAGTIWAPARTIGWVTLGLSIVCWAASRMLRTRAARPAEPPAAGDEHDQVPAMAG